MLERVIRLTAQRLLGTLGVRRSSFCVAGICGYSSGGGRCAAASTMSAVTKCIVATERAADGGQEGAPRGVLVA